MSGHYISELLRLDLWPTSSLISGKPLSIISSKLEDFENFVLNGNVASKYGTSCVQVKIDFKEVLQKSVETATGALNGLCLNCVRKGKFSTREGNCGAEDLDDCTDCTEFPS